MFVASPHGCVLNLADAWRGVASPLFPSLIGRPSEGALYDRVNVSLWFRAVLPGDGSMVAVLPASAGVPEPSSLHLSLRNFVLGVNVVVSEYDVTSNGTVDRLVRSVSGSAWHHLSLVGEFNGRFADRWHVSVDGAEYHVFSAYYSLYTDYASSADAVLPYVFTRRLVWVSNSNSTAQRGYYFDDLTVVAWCAACGSLAPATQYNTSFDAGSVALGDTLYTLPQPQQLHENATAVYCAVHSAIKMGSDYSSAFLVTSGTAGRVLAAEGGVFQEGEVYALAITCVDNVHGPNLPTTVNVTVTVAHEPPLLNITSPATAYLVNGIAQASVRELAQCL